MRYRFTRDEINISQNRYGTITLSVFIDGQYVDHSYVGYSMREAIDRFQYDYGRYPNNYKPVGTLCLCNHGGIAIMEIENGIDDYVYVCDNYGNGYENITKNLIRYNAKGEPYFVRYRKRYYLKDFIKPTTYYTDRTYGGHFTYEEMVEDARKNYDYGDSTNFLTYQSDWWKENYRVVS